MHQHVVHGARRARRFTSFAGSMPRSSTVEFVLKLLGDGYTADDITREYPELDLDGIGVPDLAAGNSLRAFSVHYFSWPGRGLAAPASSSLRPIRSIRASSHPRSSRPGWR
jgi:hypothetical protein